MTQKQCFVIRRCDRVHMLPGSFSLSTSIQTVWLHWLSGLREYGVRPGVKYRHDLIEWNTICLVWHPASVLRTIFLGMMMATNAHSPFEFWQGRLVLYMGQFIWNRTVRKKTKQKLPAILLELHLITKGSLRTNLFTHFSGRSNIGLLFWLHSSSRYDPLVRMSTTTHKQHLEKHTTDYWLVIAALSIHVLNKIHRCSVKSLPQRNTQSLLSKRCERGRPGTM